MNISPFVRNLGILALISLVILLLNLETSLVTAAILLRVAFFRLPAKSDRTFTPPATLLKPVCGLEPEPVL